MVQNNEGMHPEVDNSAPLDKQICIKDMVTSRLARIIWHRTLKEINASKRSYYEKLIDGTLSPEESISFLKIASRFLVDQTDIELQFPVGSRDILQSAWERWKIFWFENQLEVLCLEVIYTIIQTIEDSETIDETLSKYGMYTINLSEKRIIVYTNKLGEQISYNWNGDIKDIIDYGEKYNIIMLGENGYRRDNWEAFPAHVKVIPNWRWDMSLMYWEKAEGKWIIYLWDINTQNFENISWNGWKPVFVTWYNQDAGSDTKSEQIQFH